MSSLPIFAAPSEAEQTARPPIGYFKTRKNSNNLIKVDFQKSTQGRGFHVELNPSGQGTSGSFDLYKEDTIEELKKTARALALQSNIPGEDEEGNHVTSDRLPLITAPLRLTVGRGEGEEAPKRRSLLAPPRTRILGFSDASALLEIIEGTQERKQKELEKRIQTSTGRPSESLCKKTSFDLQALQNPSVLKRVFSQLVKKVKRQASRMLDKLALS